MKPFALVCSLVAILFAGLPTSAPPTDARLWALDEVAGAPTSIDTLRLRATVAHCGSIAAPATVRCLFQWFRNGILKRTDTVAVGQLADTVALGRVPGTTDTVRVTVWSLASTGARSVTAVSASWAFPNPVTPPNPPGPVVVDTTPPPGPAPPPPAPPPPAPPPPAPSPPPATPPPPPAPPGTTPTGYDPARLGSTLLAGHSLQALAQGSDTGWTALTASGNGGSIGASSTPSNPSVLALVPDPLGVFGDVVRISHRAGSSATVIRTASFPATSHFWFRQVIRLYGPDANGNTIGGFTHWFSTATNQLGESGELKMMFAWPTDNKTRMQMVLQASYHVAIGCGNGETPAATSTPMTMTASTPVMPQPAGAFAGIYLSSFPGGKVGDTTTASYPHAHAAADGDWYEWIFAYDTVSPTEYTQRYYLRRLTVSGVLTPWRDAVWLGCRQTGGIAKLYNRVQWTGNRSGTWIGPGIQYTFGGPWEVTTAADPYRLAGYGVP